MKSYYLFIAINHYNDDWWSSLEGPVRDLSGLKEVLEGKYGFEPLDFLKDEAATSDAIINWFTDLALAHRIEEDAQLLIYFSCHGMPWRHTGQQYWIAHNGVHFKREARKKEGWIESEEVIGAFRSIPCRHIILISDACFSGRLLEKYDYENHTNRLPRWTTIPKPYELARKRTSRELLTSCLDEPVVDAVEDGYSPFAKELTSILEENEAPALSVTDILPMLKRRIQHECTPAHGVLGKGHQAGGCFLFFNQTAEAAKKIQKGANSRFRSANCARSAFRKRKSVRLFAYSALFVPLCYFFVMTGQAYLQLPSAQALSREERNFVSSISLFLFAASAGFFKRKIKWAHDLSPMLCGLVAMGVVIALTSGSIVGLILLSGNIPKEILPSLVSTGIYIVLLVPVIIGSWMQFGHDLSGFQLIFLKRHIKSIVKFFVISCAAWAIPMVGFYFLSESNEPSQNLLIASGVCMVLAWILPPFFWSFFMAKRGLLSAAVVGSFTPLVSLFVVIGIVFLLVPDPISASQGLWIFPVTLFFMLSSSAGIGASLGGRRRKWRKR